MGTRPSFQFYPADWQTNLNLRRCTPTQRGAWIDCLCLFHESEEYGVVRVTLKNIAKMLNISSRILGGLASNNVLKGADKNFSGFSHAPTHAGYIGEPVLLIPACDGSCWYSSRMVIDEWRRKQRGASTRFTTDNNPRSRHLAVHPPIGLVTSPAVHQPNGLVSRLGDGPSSSTSLEVTDRESKTDRVVVPTASPTRRVGERWPADAHVPQDWIDAANDKRTNLGLAAADLTVEAELFENYWASKAGADATKLDWRKTWINWSLKAQGNRNGRKATAHDNFLAGARRVIQRAQEREAAERAAGSVREEDDGDFDSVVETGNALLETRLHGKAV